LKSRNADWEAISREGVTPEDAKLLAHQEAIARKINENAQILARYEALIDDPGSKEFERIAVKYKAAVAQQKKWMAERAEIESKLATYRIGSKALAETNGIQLFSVSRATKEERLRIRYYLAQRIKRIDVTFNATVLTAGPVKNIEAGEGRIVIKITFINGAQKWAFLDKERAVLMAS
jgi:hypothetical protein